MHSGHMLREGTWPDHLRVNMGHVNVHVTRVVYCKGCRPSARRSSPTNAMGFRIRHCVECPKCLTRYLPGFSPYRNGSYLLPLAEGFADEWTLYCACGRPPVSSRWSWSDLKLFAVSKRAHDRGYGRPEEIVPVDQSAHFSS
jgi:hypothetical protein